MKRLAQKKKLVKSIDKIYNKSSLLIHELSVLAKVCYILYNKINTSTTKTAKLINI